MNRNTSESILTLAKENQSSSYTVKMSGNMRKLVDAALAVAI